MSGIPIAAAAVSSSRIATQARPRRESRRRTLQNTVTRRITTAAQKYHSERCDDCLKLSGSPVRVDGAAPMLGQHNREVYVDWLGMPVERFDFLRASGVI